MASLVNVSTCDTEVSDCRSIVLARNIANPIAARLLHFTAILRSIVFVSQTPVEVFGGDAVMQEIVTIDENLMRHELSPAERAQQTARRKELYEALHPETAHTAFKGNQHQSGSRQNGDKQPDRFTKATAAATGQSERNIQRAARRGEQLANEIPRIKGTSLDSPGEMDALLKLKPRVSGTSSQARRSTSGHITT